MLGLMQRHPLLISSILRHAARHHGEAEVISRADDGAMHRITYNAIERRARQLAHVLRGLGVRPGDRVATLAMNGYRHIELYYAISGSGAVCNTINPRLAIDDIAYIVNHAEDAVIFADPFLAPLIEQLAPHISGVTRQVVLLCDAAEMRDLQLVPGMDLLCYEDLVAKADCDFAWPAFDENTASSLCYTSGTTGRPKGVLYSHRSMYLHSMTMNFADITALSAVDRVLALVPMFHANAWTLPYAVPMAGATLIMPGRHLDAVSVLELMNGERATLAAGVPTMWLSLLAHLQATGGRMATVTRVLSGGSAIPRALLASYEAMGVRMLHAWGMTETGPIATLNAPKPATQALTGEAGLDSRLTQGRVAFGVDVRAEGEGGQEVPWNGAAAGNLLVRGNWVANAYFRMPETSVGDAGWFPTGDVGTVDGHGFISLTDRTKDLIKSGGEWISSIALENVAMGHPDIAEAAAIAATHPKWSERPLLIAVSKPGRSVDPHVLREHFQGRVPKWWVPDRVLMVDEIPHGATGKVQKTVLRDRYRNALLVDEGPASKEMAQAVEHVEA